MTEAQLETCRRLLTILPKPPREREQRVDDGLEPPPPKKPPEPLLLYRDTPTEFGVPRQWYLERVQGRSNTQLSFDVSAGADLPAHYYRFTKTLRESQQQGVDTLLRLYDQRPCGGGIIKAGCGWGKTIAAIALIAKLQCPAIVVVHKKFLLKQWKERLQECLPDAPIGIVQGKKCDYADKAVVIAMVHTLARRNYPPEFYKHFGLFIVDETHRVAARTWSVVPGQFPTQYRLGITATPRRRDRAEAVFFHHLGSVAFESQEPRMLFQVKRVTTAFRLYRTDDFDPDSLEKEQILRYLCVNRKRNIQIVDLLFEALAAGRKILLLSERLNHLRRLHKMLTTHQKWEEFKSRGVGYYVGGMSDKALDKSEECGVILATPQFASEGLDIPAVDTVFIVTPLGDCEQSVGRAQRPHPDKKNPIIVDFRDPEVPVCESFYQYREEIYQKLLAKCVDKPSATP